MRQFYFTGIYYIPYDLNLFIPIQICTNPAAEHAHSITLETWDTLWRITLPSLARCGKLFRDKPENAKLLNGVEVMAFQGNSSGDFTNVYVHNSAVTYVRLTNNNFAPLLVNIREMSRYFSIFPVNYNCLPSGCHDVASIAFNNICHDRQSAKSNLWCNAYSVSEMNGKCKGINESTRMTWQALQKAYKNHGGGIGVLSKCSHLAVVLNLTETVKTGCHGMGYDTGGFCVPHMKMCETKKVSTEVAADDGSMDVCDKSIGECQEKQWTFYSLFIIITNSRVHVAKCGFAKRQDGEESISSEESSAWSVDDVNDLARKSKLQRKLLYDSSTEDDRSTGK